jgi:pilus assembly protein Flp/PilA
VRYGRHDDQGTSAVEYSLLLTAIATVLVSIVYALGGATGGLYSDTCSRIASQVTFTATC